MNPKIFPCLWMNHTAKEAALFYCKAFRYTTVAEENPYAVVIQSAGQNFMLLNGGPAYSPNPSLSFFVHITDPQELEETWQALQEGGKIMMPLGRYDWSAQYGWVEDKFGVSWQVSLGKEGDVASKFAPYFTFTGQVFGNAEAAVQFYTRIFPGSTITGILKHKENQDDEKETVLHAQFNLCEQVFMAGDSGFSHSFSFGAGISLVISCHSQEEIDFYWENLTKGGSEEMCGWLSDPFGVSWQVIPSKMGEWMALPEKRERVARAFMQMKKLDWQVLENA